MKILIATDNYPPRYDGISRFLQEILPSLNEKYDVQVIAPDFGPTNDEYPVTKIGVSKISVGDFHLARVKPIKIFNLVRKSDVVFIQALGSIGLPALISAKILRKKTLLYVHSIEWELVPRALRVQWLKRWLPGMMKVIDRVLYGMIDLLLMPSQGISDTYDWNKINNKRRIIHLGVDTKKFAPCKDKQACKRAAGVPEEALVIGYHGRLAREKDLRTLLRGFQRLKAMHPEQRFHLLIVGDGLSEVREMFYREDVTVTGFREDVVPFLQAMDVYALTSLTETSCLSVMEAMSCALPVVSTPVGYVKDYIKDGINGYLFPEKDAVLLMRHLEALMDEELRKKLGAAARKSIQQRYSWDRTREQVIDSIEELTTKK